MRKRLASRIALFAVALAPLCACLTVTAAPKAPDLTLKCPAYLIPDRANVLQYQVTTSTAGRLTILRIDPEGKASAKPLVDMPVRLAQGNNKTIILKDKLLPPATADYLVRLTAGKHQVESRCQVKAWDLIGCFYGDLPEDFIKMVDEARSKVPEGYNPDWDPMVDDEAEPEPTQYCPEIDPATLTSKHVMVSVRYWDQSKPLARHLYITSGVRSKDISAQDWQQVWGAKPSSKAWHDEREAVLYTLNGTFYTTSQGQSYVVTMFVAKGGIVDEAGNEFDANPDTDTRESTVIESIRIDGDGNVSGDRYAAVPHKNPALYKASPQPPKPKKLTRFEKFYPIYRDHIAEIVAERDRLDAEGRRRATERLAETSRSIEKSENEILARWRAEGKRQEWPDGEAEENLLCIPTSDASAHLFAQVIKEELLPADGILSRLGWQVESLTPGWIALVRDVLNAAEPGSRLAEQAAEILYRAGVGEEHRPALEKRALQGDPYILYRLFFTVDPDTHLPKARQSQANDALLNTLCGPKSGPQIRATCAAYAAATGKTSLAEKICEEVCSIPYKGVKDVDDKEERPPKEDSAIFDARHGIGHWPGVLSTLFYQVRTEKAFRIILERSSALRGIEHSSEPVPPYWKRLRYYHLAKWELEAADGMIFVLKDFEKRQKDKPK